MEGGAIPMLSCIRSFLFSPKTWIFLLILAFFVRRLISKSNRSVDQLLPKDIFSKYLNSFSTKLDLVFFVFVSAALAMLTLIQKPINDDVVNFLGVIISILIGAVLNFMAMAEDKKATASSKNIRSINETRALGQGTEALSIGIIEIILSIILLILLFFVPAPSNKALFYFVCFWVYALFYFFLFNIFFMTKRLYEICEEVK